MRLIDADALLNYEGKCYDEDDHLLYAVGTRTIMRMPTIDAVPVVRCKDCKRFKRYGIFRGYTIGLCEEDAGHPRSVELDDFCSHGERGRDVD